MADVTLSFNKLGSILTVLAILVSSVWLAIGWILEKDRKDEEHDTLKAPVELLIKQQTEREKITEVSCAMKRYSAWHCEKMGYIHGVEP